MKSKLNSGFPIGIHMYENSFEIIYIIQREVKCILDEKENFVKHGQAHNCSVVVKILSIAMVS